MTSLLDGRIMRGKTTIAGDEETTGTDATTTMSQIPNRRLQGDIEIVRGTDPGMKIVVTAPTPRPSADQEMTTAGTRPTTAATQSGTVSDGEKGNAPATTATTDMISMTGAIGTEMETDAALIGRTGTGRRRRKTSMRCCRRARSTGVK